MSGDFRNARKGKGSDREKRVENKPKRKDGEHRIGKQGGNGSKRY